jgi:hypothetical protein
MKTNLIMAAAASLGLAACHSGIKGNGHFASQDRAVPAFTSVEISNGLSAEISQGDATSVTVRADENLQPHIITKVEGNTLKIGTDGVGWIESDGMKVVVKMKDIQNLSFSGGSSVTTSGVLRGPQTVVKVSSGSDASLNFEADKLIAQVSSGSHLTLSGKALSMDISSSGGSDVDAEKFTANDINAQASGGSSMDVHAAVNLTAKASSGSSISYAGNPKIVREESSGSSISPK